MGLVVTVSAQLNCRPSVNMALSLTLLRIVLFIRVPRLTDCRQYCHNEVFRAECPPGQAILTTAASYGRMSLGRCVKTDFGFVGCSVDVIDHVHRRCSGRRVCNVRVPDSTLDLTRPCNDDLKSYLDVSYTCVGVTSSTDDGSCRLSYSSDVTATVKDHRAETDVKLIGYLGSRMPPATSHRRPVGLSPDSAATECGSDRTPWLVSARPGQRIRITVMDFTAHASMDLEEEIDEEYRRTLQRREAASEPAHSMRSPMSSVIGHCVRHYATVVDVATNRTVEICGSGDRDVTLTSSIDVDRLTLTSDPYTTEGHRASVVVHQSSFSSSLSTSSSVVVFLMKFDAVGCPDIVPPPGGNVWIHRAGDRITMGCATSRSSTADVVPLITWHLFCVDGRWDGTWRNCSVLPDADSSSDAETESSSLQMLYNGFAVGIILSVTLLMGLLVTSIGICFMQRYWRDPFTSGLARNRLKAGSPSRTETVSIGGIQRRRWRPGQRTTMTRLTDVTGYLTDTAPDVHSCSFADVFDQRSTDVQFMSDFIVCDRHQDDPLHGIVPDMAAVSFMPVDGRSCTVVNSCNPTSQTSPRYSIDGHTYDGQIDEISMNIRIPAAAAAAADCVDHRNAIHQPRCYCGSGNTSVCDSALTDNHLNAQLGDPGSVGPGPGPGLGRRAVDYGVALQQSMPSERNTSNSFVGDYTNTASRSNCRTDLTSHSIR